VGAVSISEDNAVVLAGASNAASLSLTAETGSITDDNTANVTVAGLASFSAETGITLDDTYNFGSLSTTVTQAGGATVVTEADGLTNLTVSTNDGDVAITFGADSLTFTAAANALNFNAAGTNVSFTNSEGIDLTGTSSANNLSLTATTGAITDASDADLTITGNASFTANGTGGAITLGDEGNNADSFGSLTFNSVGAVSISEDNAVVIAGTNTALSLSLTAEAGTITDATDADITVTNNASFTANGTGGAITLGDEGNNADSFGSLTFNSVGAVSISQDTAIVVSGLNTANSLSLTAEAGSITDANGADITVAGNASFTANGLGGSITLGDQPSNNDSFGSLTFKSGGAVSISQDTAIVIAGTNTADSLSLTAEAGSITDATDADITVANNASFTANGTGGAITLGDHPSNNDSFGSLTFKSGGAVSISQDDSIVLSGTNTANTLSLTSEAGAITDDTTTSVTVAGDAHFTGVLISLADDAGDVLSVDGNASFTANAGGITIGAAGAVNFGTLTFNATEAVSIAEDSSMNIVGVNTADSATLRSSSGISDADATSVTVTDLLDVSGTSISLGGGTFNAGTLTFNSGGAVIIHEDSSMDLVGANTAGSATLSAVGALSDAGAMSVTVNGLADLSGSSISLGTGTFNAGTLTFNSTGAVSITESSSMDLVGVNTAGSATLAATGSISDAGATSVNVTGLTDVNGTSISLGGGIFNTGTLRFNSGGAVSIAEDSSTALTGSNTAGSLVLGSAGAITDAAGTSLSVTDNASLAGSAITLGDSPTDTTNFGSLTFSSTGAVTISEDSATVLSGTNQAASLSLTSSGSVTQTTGSTLTVAGEGSVNAGANAVTLTNANDFQGLLTVTGGATKVNDVNALEVKLVNTGETYIIANTGGGTGEFSVGGTSGNLIAVSNGGVLRWDNLTTTNALLVAGTPRINGVNDPAGLKGPGSKGNAFAINTDYVNLANATGNSLKAPGGEVVLIANNVPGNGTDTPSITANSAVLDINGLQPPSKISIFLNGELRLLVESGTFQFAGGNITGGVKTLNPDAVSVFVGGVSFTSARDELAARSAISAAQQSALTNASSDARQSFGTDSVTQQIDMGFSGDVGIAPTMGHSVPLQGEIISTPAGVSESKGGQ
jgi:N-acetylglucosamine-6-phosphate deacetylase